jgi:hypothetical protein
MKVLGRCAREVRGGGGAGGRCVCGGGEGGKVR